MQRSAAPFFAHIAHNRLAASNGQRRQAKAGAPPRPLAPCGEAAKETASRAPTIVRKMTIADFFPFWMSSTSPNGSSTYSGRGVGGPVPSEGPSHGYSGQHRQTGPRAETGGSGAAAVSNLGALSAPGAFRTRVSASTLTAASLFAQSILTVRLRSSPSASCAAAPLSSQAHCTERG
jgi:hypothetical protein